jgi:hypothetical protein
MKIRPVGAELLHADGRSVGRTDGLADMTKLIVAFLTFANAPKKDIITAVKVFDFWVKYRTWHLGTKRPLFYPTTFLCQFLPLFSRVCGLTNEWAKLRG